jgi:hypothetical protein
MLVWATHRKFKVCLGCTARTCLKKKEKMALSGMFGVTHISYMCLSYTSLDLWVGLGVSF